MWWGTSVIQATTESIKMGDHGPGQPGKKSKTLFTKNPNKKYNKRARDVGQTVECLCSKYAPSKNEKVQLCHGGTALIMG